MKLNTCTVAIHMVSSLDGFIAKKDNSVSWFETSSNYEKGVAEQDPDAFQTEIDCYVMGSRTYEHALELSESYGWVYGEKPTIVLTSRNLPNDRENVTFYSGDLREFVHEQLKPKHRNVWVVGGAVLAREFIRQNLADEIRVVILPIILGEGLLYFDDIGQEKVLQLKDATAYRNGMVELCYEIQK